MRQSVLPDISVCYFGRFDICFVVDKILTPSPWTTPMHYPKIDYATEV